MKKLLFSLFIAGTFFIACQEKDEPTCPTVDAELVPAIVRDSFAAHYPSVMVETWYKVDALGFCAKFPQPPNTVFAHFGVDGTFQEEKLVDANGKEVDVDNQQEENDHQDEGDNEDDTCECK